MALHVLPDPGQVLVYSCVNSWKVLSCTVHPKACHTNNSVTVTEYVRKKSTTRVSITSISSTIPCTELGSSDSDPGYCCIGRGTGLLGYHWDLSLSQPVLWPST